MSSEEETETTITTAAKNTRNVLSCKPESEIEMITRLLMAVDNNEKERSQKRRYILQNFPERKKKRPNYVVLLDDLYVPEIDLRSEKDFHKIKEFVCSQSKEIPKPPTNTEVCLDNLQQMSDNEILSMAPSLLCQLKLQTLTDLLSALSTPNLTTNSKQSKKRVIAREVKERLTTASSESLLEVASILRCSSSYEEKFHFSQLPKSVLKATRLVFQSLGSFPRYILRLILDILGCKFKGNLNRMRMSKIIQKQTDNMIKEHLKNTTVNGHLGQYDIFPLCIQWTIQFIQFSSKVVLNNDGGIGRIVKPLSSRQVSLEAKCIAAISRLNSMRYKDLLRIGSLIDVKPREIGQYIIKSVPHIYSDESLPGHVMELVSMISNSSWEAETIAVMDVSAHVRSVLRDCYEGLIKVEEEPEENSVLNDFSIKVEDEEQENSVLNDFFIKVEDEEQNENSVLNGVKSIEELSNFKVKECETIESSCLNMNRVEIDRPDGTEEVHVEPDCVGMQTIEDDLNLEEDIKIISDEIATAAYVLVDRLLKRILRNETSLSMTDPTTHVNISTHNLTAEKLVLDIANECTTFPRRVIETAERHMDIYPEADIS